MWGLICRSFPFATMPLAMTSTSRALERAALAGHKSGGFGSILALGGRKLIHFGGQKLIRPEVQYSVYLLRASLG